MITRVTAARLTPACRAALQALAEAVVEADGKAAETASAGRLVEIDAQRLLSGGARAKDTAPEWLADVLEQLSAIRLQGVARRVADGATGKGQGGAGLIAEWWIVTDRRRRRGPLCRILLTPLAQTALRDGATRVRLDAETARSLPGHAGRLLGLLLDRRRAGEWLVGIDELKAHLGLADRYRFAKDLRKRVIEPAVAAINASGSLRLEPPCLEARGRAFVAVRFRWSDPGASADAEATPSPAGLTISDEPPLVMYDRLARWLAGQPLRVRRSWWARARAAGAPNRTHATDPNAIGSWVGWICEDLAAALAVSRSPPEDGCRLPVDRRPRRADAPAKPGPKAGFERIPPAVQDALRTAWREELDTPPNVLLSRFEESMAPVTATVRTLHRWLGPRGSTPGRRPSGRSHT